MEEKNDLGIKHLAHEHLLIPHENYVAKYMYESCRLCHEKIDSGKSFVYSCCGESCRSHFLLHKTCAELPPKIVNPLNLNEFLSFSDSYTKIFVSTSCIICGLRSSRFHYCSSLNTNIYVCFKCALFQFPQSKEDLIYVHQGHSHPLAIIEEPSSFKCRACKVNENILDSSYRCTKCQFWIHKSCGDAPHSFQFQFHRHPLILSFSLPEAYRKFDKFCRICNERLHWIEWLYCCCSCRYFTHFRCARSSPMLSSDENETCPNNLVHLPAADELSVNLLLEKFIKDKITLSNSYNNSSISGATNYIKHWAHVEHDLKLITINELYDGKYDDEISLLCECCVKPIQTYDDTLFYGCVPCKYFMHKVCAEFPREVEHHLWPGQTLCANKYSEPFKFFRCDSCRVAGNGIFFSVRLFNKQLSICLHCVSLPKVIKHEAHHHQLDQVFCDNECNACGYRRYVIECINYICKKCKFYLCGRCIMMARTYKHRWDPHPLDLIFDAGMVEKHEHEFDCEYCSEEIDTRSWFYHCSKCDLSFHSSETDSFYFHPLCIEKSSFREYKYVKFGATDIIRDDLHPHRLTFVYNKKVRRCEICDHESLGEPVLQCAPCNVIFCWRCYGWRSFISYSL